MGLGRDEFEVWMELVRLNLGWAWHKNYWIWEAGELCCLRCFFD